MVWVTAGMGPACESGKKHPQLPGVSIGHLWQTQVCCRHDATATRVWSCQWVIAPEGEAVDYSCLVDEEEQGNIYRQPYSVIACETSNSGLSNVPPSFAFVAT